MFMKFVFAALTSVLLSTSAAQADVFDRINACQANGGGACVFDLLRELARSNPSAPTVPVGGAYRQSENNALCADQFIAAVAASGTLSAVRLGWCGTQFNMELPCVGNVCTLDGTTVEVMTATTYRFTNNAGNSAVFTKN